MRYARDVIVVSCGALCVLSQIIVQFRGGDISGELLTVGVTLLTAEAFIKIGDRRADRES